MPEDAIGRMVGEGASTLVARAFAAARLPPPPDALERFLEIYDARLLIHTRPYDGIVDVLEALGPHASLAVLTNKPLRATRQILDGLDLARHFPYDAVVGGDGPFPRKPDPGGFRHLMARAGADPASSVLVGDSIIDWRTAKGASSRACLARYGFGFETLPLAELDADVCVVDAPSELLACFFEDPAARI